MGSNDVQTIPIGINVRSAVRCAKAVHQPWKAHDTSLPDPKSIVGLNRENTTLEIGISKAIPHGRLAVAVAFPARGWAFAFAFSFACVQSFSVTEHLVLFFFSYRELRMEQGLGGLPMMLCPCPLAD